MGKDDVFANSRQGFFQEQPTLLNQFTSDVYLQRVMQSYLPADYYARVEPDMRKLGDYVISEEMMDALTDAERNVPYVIPYTAYGRRIDKLITTWGWKHMKKISAKEG